MEGVVRNTEQGPVRGKIEARHYLWAGIPFAAPITRETRFKIAQNAITRDTELNCTKFRHTAVQAVFKLNGPASESDDCLFLNVYAPLEEASEKRPVLFWIHGGGFTGGSGAGYSGAKLAEEQGIVVVTINYRLAVCGFTNWNSILRDSSKRFDDNVGLKDQAKALEWVHRNIANFGGDPDRITIAGESAGGSSVAMLMTDSSLRKFYHQAIIQSGSVNILDNPDLSRRKAAHCAKFTLLSLMPSLGEEDRRIVQQAIDSNDYTHQRVADIIVCTSTRVIQDGIIKGLAETEGRLPYGAWYDGVTFPPSRAEAMNWLPSDVKVLIGHNKDESMLWPLMLPEEPEELPISERTLTPILEKIPEPARTAIRKCYPLSKSEGWLELSSDVVFINATRRLAKELVKKGCCVYRYRLDKISEEGTWSSCAPHGVDLLAFWDMPWSRTFARSSLTGGDKCDKLMRHMRDCWGDFVRQGDPGWRQYDLRDFQMALFNCLYPSYKEIKSAFSLPEEMEQKVAAWEDYELII